MPRSAARRIRVELPLHLTITLDGDPHERTAAYLALLDDVVEHVERIGPRYYLSAARGESITARIPEECDILELPVSSAPEAERRPRRPTPGGAAPSKARRPERTTAGGGGGAPVARPKLRLVAGGLAKPSRRAR